MWQADEKLKQYFNAELVEVIATGQRLLADFYVKKAYMVDSVASTSSNAGKRSRIEDPDYSQVPPRSLEMSGRPAWKAASVDYQENGYKYKNHGSRQPFGRTYSGNQLILELSNHRIWSEEVDIWEQTVVRNWFRDQKPGTDMFNYLETSLGVAGLGIWQSAKKADAEKINQIKALGENPCNFTSLIRTLVLGLDPGRETTFIQDSALRNLEQLTIADMKYIEPFSIDFFALIAKTGKAFDDELCNRYFTKLPGDLGKKIHEEWNNKYGSQRNLGIGTRVQFTYHKLKEYCKEDALKEQVRRNSFAFCRKAIYSPQQYGSRITEENSEKVF